jgi:hypothetical protein
MSVIITFKMENEISNLENNIKNLKSLHDILTFQIIIHNSINSLMSMSRLIKNRNNSFGKNIATKLLINIISFLSSEHISICRRVCTTWLKSLKSNLSKKILLIFPKNIQYCQSFDVGFNPNSMMRVKNHIYISNKSNVCKINMKNSEISIVDGEYYMANFTSANDNYICIFLFKIRIYIFS